jgi:hypothetical protein
MTTPSDVFLGSVGDMSYGFINARVWSLETDFDRCLCLGRITIFDFLKFKAIELRWFCSYPPKELYLWCSSLLVFKMSLIFFFSFWRARLCLAVLSAFWPFLKSRRIKLTTEVWLANSRRDYKGRLLIRDFGHSPLDDSFLIFKQNYIINSLRG